MGGSAKKVEMLRCKEKLYILVFLFLITVFMPYSFVVDSSGKISVDLG